MTSDPGPFIPYGRQKITESDIRAVVEILRSDFLTQGPTVSAFEQAVAAKVGARHAVAVNSATSALHIACLALGLGPGDLLWTSPITFVASANCGRYCGADVDFVDIDPETGLMSVTALATKLKDAELKGKLPKVVVPVHLCGTSCDMSSISELADRYGFSVLEDASHAIGGRYKGQSVGSCIYSAITVFSFHPKIITSGVVVWLRPPTLNLLSEWKNFVVMVSLKTSSVLNIPQRVLGAMSSKILVLIIV